MRKSSRENAPAPDFIVDNWEQWGINWQTTHAGSGTFTWHGHREEIATALYPMTDSHCAYCDVDNCVVGNNATIDHFQPKTISHLIAYFWNNLFLCCGECQKRIDAFSDLLIKPDEAYYNFDDFFRIDSFNGKILPNESMPKNNIDRANYTIDKFRLNYGERPRLRKKELDKYIRLVGKEINQDELIDWSYRFYIEKYLTT